MHDDHIHQPALTIAGTVIAAVAAIAVLGALGLPIAGLVLVGGAFAQPTGFAGAPPSSLRARMYGLSSSGRATS